MKDAGKVTICRAVNVAEQTHMPVMMLEPLFEEMFERRIVGFNRHYAALGVNQEITAMIRIWRQPVKIGMYAVIEDSEYLDGQYRIDFVQPLNDYDGLKVCDLTLYAVDDNFDIYHREDLTRLEVVVIYDQDDTPEDADISYLGNVIPDLGSMYLNVDGGRVKFLLPGTPDQQWILWNKKQRPQKVKRPTVTYSAANKPTAKDIKKLGNVSPTTGSVHLNVTGGTANIMMPGRKWKTWQYKNI